MATRKTSQQSKTLAKVAGDYVQIVNPSGYLHNREITNLPGQFLVPPSINVFIENGEKVVSRNGHTLLGAKKTSTIGTNSSYDWNEISSGDGRSIRQRGTILECYYGPTNSWIQIGTLSLVNKMSFASWWSATESIDFLLGVQGEGTISEWSGAIVPIASVTSSTITKQKYVTGSDIAFVNGGTDGAGNALPGSITKVSGGFVSANFQAGDILQPSGSISNNAPYLIKAVTNTALTIDAAYPVTNETAGPAVILQLQGGSTWSTSRAHSANAGISSDRAFNLNGKKYAYTGGENSGTLTGVSPDPSLDPAVVNGVLAVQTIRSYAPSALSGYAASVIFTVQNQLCVGSSLSRVILGSKNSDFTDFTFTTPLRKPGEGFSLTLDACPTGFAPGPYLANIASPASFYITAKPDFWYRVIFYQQSIVDNNSVSQIYETTPCIRIPTGKNSAAISQDVIIPIKNSVMYASRDNTIEELGTLVRAAADSPKTAPISDSIKKDIEAYDLTNSHGVYMNRTLWLTVPSLGYIIPFDFTNEYWQPPQTANVARLAVIEINGVETLCGHAANSDETYILFDGMFNDSSQQKYTDNGATIKWIAAYGYENYGSRFAEKRFDEMASELYIAPATIVHDDCYLDYGGFTYIHNKIIDLTKNPAMAFSPVGSAGEGENPEGYAPMGSTTDIIPVLIKARVIQDCTSYSFFERQRIFWSDSLGGHAEILAYGENIQGSEELPTYLHQ